MANYKRKRPHRQVLRDCNKGCKYDGSRYGPINGRERYLPNDWKKLGGRKAWRYGDVGTIYYHS